MMSGGIQRIEFRPERDILGKTIARNGAGRRVMTGCRGL